MLSNLNNFKSIISLAYMLYPIDEIYYLNSIVDDIILNKLKITNDVILGIIDCIDGLNSEMYLDLRGINLMHYCYQIVSNYDGALLNE